MMAFMIRVMSLIMCMLLPFSKLEEAYIGCNILPACWYIIYVKIP